MSQKPTVLLILGGQNSRFEPFNTRTHKGALTLLGQSLVGRTLAKLAKAGYQDIVIVLNPRDSESQGLPTILPQDFPQLNLKFVTQEKATGMGNAILLARQYLSNQFVVSSGYHDQLAEVADRLLKLGTEVAVTASQTNQPWEYGILEVASGRAKSLIEKPIKGQELSNLKIQTIYLLNQEYLELLAQEPDEQYNFETALNKYMHGHEVGVYETKLPTLKYAWHLFEWQQHYFSQLKSYRDATAEIADSAILDESQGPVYVAANAFIGDFVKIIGPAYIGANAMVGDFSFVRQSSLEAGVQVGASTEVARSILMENSTIHFGYIADSILGQEVRVGAGLITANKRLDRSTIPVTIKDKKIDTQRPAQGILVGDKAQLGIRVSTMPGVIIGAGATVFPGQVLYKNVAHQAVIKPKAE